MPSSNRTQIATVVETTLGTTPNSPRMRLVLITGENLSYNPTFDTPDELRSDRMTSDPIMTGVASAGTVNFNLNYPLPNTPEDVNIQSAFYNSWTNTPSRDNDAVAASVITNVATTGTIVTVTTGPAFVAGQLVRFSGFGVTGNNGVFPCTTGSATVPAFVGSGITNEASPAAAARMKVVGFIGASADITATASGLGSTTLDFTTLGMAAGQWIKIGGTGAGNQFATAVCNTKARITAISAHAITLDNLPSGWTTDTGTGKTIKVWFGDQIKNGSTQVSQTIERGFMGQVTPTYIVQRGMVVSQLALTFAAKTKVTAVATFMGMSGSQSTTTLDSSPDPAPLMSAYPVFACSANVGRVGEGGSTLASPNFVNNLVVTIANNVTTVDSIDGFGPQGLTGHEATVTGTLKTYFGDNTLLTKFYAGTPTSLNCALQKGSQMLILSLPRVTYNSDGSPNASGKNVDIPLSLGFAASKDEALTNAIVLLDRFEYME